MTLTFRAHFDGKVIVPDEPVELPEGQPFDVELRIGEREADPRKAALQRVISRAIPQLNLPAEALRRERIYHDAS